MENRDYEEILNAMPETGVYVIRETDHGLLYFNKRVREVSPEARLGVPCHEVWAGSCGSCPLLTIGSRQESRAVSYNSAYGGVVDITATRTVWERSVPAFVVTVAPRVDAVGYTYRKILYANLVQDRCDVLKSDPDGWQPGEGSLIGQLVQFAYSGSIHPKDADRFAAFARNLGKPEAPTLIYRRQGKNGYRWNLIEIIPDHPDDGGDLRSAIICFKDVHDVLREGLEREGVNARSQELIRTLGERNFSIYTIDLVAGGADPVRVDGQMRGGLAPLSLPWDELMRTHIQDRLHEAYQEEFARRFSLEGLRRAKEQQKTELLCQWRGKEGGEDYRYISVTAYFGQEQKDYAILALQDVDERMRQELAHTKRDMQMAAILKCRYQMMNTVYLDTGLCERVDLTRSAGPENTLTGDYEAYIQAALEHHVHPDDAPAFRALLSLDHLREKAATIRDYGEEICQYRILTEPICWIELHVLYSRQGEQVMVNILGQDITEEKQQEDMRVRALEDRAYMITSLSSLFFSTYYIDLERDTFRAVTQQRRVGDLLGNEVNFTAALRLYANHFVHPEDRKRYLDAMEIQNLRQSLRWWQPYIAVEYRKMLEDGGGCSWVRATAVLARTGADDLPKTVVYVARDIVEAEAGSVER